MKCPVAPSNVWKAPGRAATVLPRRGRTPQWSQRAAFFSLMAQAQPHPARAGVLAVQHPPCCFVLVATAHLPSSMALVSKCLPQCCINPQVLRPPHLLPL